MHMLVALLLAAPVADLKQQGEPGLAAIHPDALSAHIHLLAGDLLEGRGTGSRGHAIAARYLATQLQSLGFEAAGDKATFFQNVPLVGMTARPDQCALEIDGTPLKYGEEVIFQPRAGSASDDVSGELVFVGYAISAPEYGYDDLPDDLQGKIAVEIFGAPRSDRPDFFPTAASAVYSDKWEKSRRLARRGAVAMLEVFTPEVEKNAPFPFFTRQAGLENMVWKEGETLGGGYALPNARLPVAMLRRLLAKSGHTAEEVFAAGPAGKLKPFPLGMRARLRVGFAVREFTSENVVGVLRGHERAQEYVAITAHVDHLGIGPPMNGDTIYNGALDNASGDAAAIEIARAFSALPRRPPRSILIAFVTGEEKGLLGSEYFVRHATVPIGSIVAEVNLDGVNMRWPTHDMVALGAEHSTLDQHVRAALNALGLKESPDPEPEEVFFIRSDQYNFVRQGIPSVFPRAGWLDENGTTEKNKAATDWWRKNRYHTPQDEWDPKGDYASMATETRADFLIALSVALDPQRPCWNDGDVFGKMFVRRAPAR